MKHKIKFSLMGVATLLASLSLASSASAWGPERETFTMEKPASYPTFNSITDNPALGNERDFVRIVEKGINGTYVNELEIEGGKQYEVYIYFHNNASSSLNSSAKGNVGVAREVRLAASFPHELAKGQKGTVAATISAANTNPTSVWDEAFMVAKEAVTIHYVTGSAKIHVKPEINGNKTTDGMVVSTNMFGETGTYLGLLTADPDLSPFNGVIPGCQEYSGSVTYTLQTVAVPSDDPEDPDPVDPVDPDPEDPTPETPVTPTPDVPKELPKTGPVEIVLAIVIISAIIAAVIYWNKTHKAVKKATRHAKSKK